ncbi:hypothetical protein BDZ89DRAFT_278660 [Hymenopellis radicata]|nr:hypothetical protein BDZ89DRAFT_278660 [Hymenopellis radicata]
MPASAHDSCSTDDRSTTRDVSDDELPDEDAESDYQSCASYTSDEDEEHMAEEYVYGELQILQWNYIDYKYQASEVQNLQVVGASMTRTKWISEIELAQWFDAFMEVEERSLDAVAVLAETVGGPARKRWHHILSDQEKLGLRRNYFFDLQILLTLIMSSKGAWTNNYC